MTDLQLDDVNPMAPMLDAVPPRRRPAPRLLPVGQRLLRTWDFHQGADSSAAAYYNVVWRNLLALTFDDDLPKSASPDGGDRWYAVVTQLLERPDDPWWDDSTTDDQVETRDDILRTRDARRPRRADQPAGARPDRVDVGPPAPADLHNRTLGRVRHRAGRRGSSTADGWQVGGGSAIVDAIGWDAVEGYDVTWVPSMRMVVSLADLDKSRWVNLTGASGTPSTALHRPDRAVGRRPDAASGRSPDPSVDAAEDRLTLDGRVSGGGTTRTG